MEQSTITTPPAYTNDLDVFLTNVLSEDTIDVCGRAQHTGKILYALLGRLSLAKHAGDEYPIGQVIEGVNILVGILQFELDVLALHIERDGKAAR